MGKAKIDIIGEKYGKLTVISEHSVSRTGKPKYLCQCECGNTKAVLKTHLRQGNTKSCGCSKKKKGKDHKDWKGCGDISGNMWHNMVVRSANGAKGRRKAVDIDIDVKFGWELFLKQDKKCALSGLPLYFSKTSVHDRNASMDRIDSSKGYVKGNVQWVHKDINMMKNVYSQEYFIRMCTQVAEYQGGKCEI